MGEPSGQTRNRQHHQADRNLSCKRRLYLAGHRAQAPAPEKKKVAKEYREAIKSISIVAATAGITVLFITALALLAKFVL